MKNINSPRRLLAGLLCALLAPSPLTAGSIRTAAAVRYSGVPMLTPAVLPTASALVPIVSLVPAVSFVPAVSVAPNASVVPIPSVIPNAAVAPGVSVAPVPSASVFQGLQAVQQGLTDADSREKGGIAAQKSLGAVFDGSGNNNAGVPPSAASRPAGELDSFVEKAKALFYPNGQTPAVAVAKVSKPQGVPTDGDLNSRMELSPLTNPEREKAIKELFLAAGARAEDIQIQDAGRNRHNIFVVKKGKTDRVVIVGAHHDKVSEGAGTIDNWTGATMMINLYQAMHDAATDATYVFIAFAREEEGLIGSEHYLESLSGAQRKKVDSMVNLDTLGVDGTYSWKNNSTRVLLDLIQKVAAQEKRALIEALLDGGDADSSTFKRVGIPAMTIFGASQEIIFDIIHSERDTMAVFSLPHYKNAYLLTLALLKALDLSPVRR